MGFLDFFSAVRDSKLEAIMVAVQDTQENLDRLEDRYKTYPKDLAETRAAALERLREKINEILED